MVNSNSPIGTGQARFSWRAAYDWFSESFNIYSLVAATGVGGWVAKVMPFDWKTPTPWLLTIAAVSGTFAAFRTIRAAYEKWRRWLDPPSVKLVPGSGLEGTLALYHYGRPTTVEMHARIVDVTGMGEPGREFPMRPVPWRVKLQKYGQIFHYVTLGNDDWVTATLVTMADAPKDSGFTGRGLRVLMESGPLILGTRPAQKGVGVTFEVVLASSPVLRDHERRWYFEAKMTSDHQLVSFSEVPAPSASVVLAVENRVGVNVESNA